MALTLKETVAAVWQKFMGVIGYTDISSIGDGTVKGAISELNGKKIAVGTNVYTNETGHAVAEWDVLTTSAINNLLGVTGSSNMNTIVVFSNGDKNAANVKMTTYCRSNGIWGVQFDPELENGKSFRVNYIVARTY